MSSLKDVKSWHFSYFTKIFSASSFHPFEDKFYWIRLKFHREPLWTTLELMKNMVMREYFELFQENGLKCILKKSCKM